MLEVKLNQAQLNRQVRHLLARLPGELREPAVKKVAFDVLHDVQLGIYTGGFGNPKRVDTGRYVSGWRLAMAQLGVGPAPDASLAQPGDGRAEVRTSDGKTIAVLTNAVEYGSYVEYGTSTMRAGNHVAVALQRATEGTRQVVTQLMRSYWEGS